MPTPTDTIELSIHASSFGHELDISWNNELLQPGEKVFIFKRSQTNVTDEEIAAYFANIDDLSNFNYNGLFVFDKNITPTTSAIGDYEVANEVTYYYRAAVRLSGQYSLAGSVSATPRNLVKVNVLDGKQLVVKAIEKMFENIVNRDGQSVNMRQDIKIVKHFTIEPISENYIMVERINGSNYMQFLGQQYASTFNQTIYGDTDTDVIRATFITTDSSDRRDKVANIFRSNKFFLLHMLKKLGAREPRIMIEGDYYNPQIHGVSAQGFMVVFTLLLDNLAMHPKDVVTQITATELIVDQD